MPFCRSKFHPCPGSESATTEDWFARLVFQSKHGIILLSVTLKLAPSNKSMLKSVFHPFKKKRSAGTRRKHPHPDLHNFRYWNTKNYQQIPILGSDSVAKVAPPLWEPSLVGWVNPHEQPRPRMIVPGLLVSDQVDCPYKSKMGVFIFSCSPPRRMECHLLRSSTLCIGIHCTPCTPCRPGSTLPPRRRYVWTLQKSVSW